MNDLHHQLILKPLRVILRGLEEGLSVRVVAKQLHHEALFTQKYPLIDSAASIQEQFQFITSDLQTPLELTLLVCFQKIKTPEIIGSSKLIPSTLLSSSSSSQPQELLFQHSAILYYILSVHRYVPIYRPSSLSRHVKGTHIIRTRRQESPHDQALSKSGSKSSMKSHSKTRHLKIGINKDKEAKARTDKTTQEKGMQQLIGQNKALQREVSKIRVEMERQKELASESSLRQYFSQARVKQLEQENTLLREETESLRKTVLNQAETILYLRGCMQGRYHQHEQAPTVDSTACDESRNKLAK